MAMKTTKSNWRVEVRPAVFAVVTEHSSDEICEEVCNELMQEMVDGRCPEMPAHCIEVKCDEEHICNSCKRPWYGPVPVRQVMKHMPVCYHCGMPAFDNVDKNKKKITPPNKGK